MTALIACVSLLKEIWLPVIGYEGLYEVSNRGRIWSIRSKIFLAQTANRDGRLGVSLSKGGVAKRRLVHQVVAEAFIGPRPPGMETRHLNDNFLDNLASNLVYGDRSANQQDLIRNGKNPKLNRTHCTRGHEYTPETILTYRGVRDCKTCSYEDTAAWTKANPERRREIGREAMRRYRARQRAKRISQ